jgi:hypothetical protein
LNKPGFVVRVQHGGIGERELAKILFGDEALLNHLKRFGYDIRKVGHSKCVKSELNTGRSRKRFEHSAA